MARSVALFTDFLFFFYLQTTYFEQMVSVLKYILSVSSLCEHSGLIVITVFLKYILYRLENILVPVKKITEN